MTDSNRAPWMPGVSDESEFEDYQGDLALPGGSLVWSQLFTAPVLRGAAALVIGIVLLALPRSARLFGVAVAAFLVVWAVGEAFDAFRRRDRNLLVWLKVAGLLGAATVMLLWPSTTEDVVARITGYALIVYAAYDAYTRLRAHSEDRVPGLIGDSLAAMGGVALLVVPGVVFVAVLLAIAVVSIIGGIVAMVTGLRPGAETTGVSNVWATTLNWIEDRPHTADDRRQLYQKLFFEGPPAMRRLSRFFILMGLAAVISGYGIAADSTAVIVGAMLIAPLMTPLMGTSASIVMGWPRRAGMSAVVALCGIALAVFVGWIIAASVAIDLDPVTNPQIASRITPTLIDVAIAVAAGGAGAFALSRPDVSDALPGVAVAISLVPPLVVAGLMLRETDYESAGGALLLFSTNAVAILLAGAVVFILTGVVPIRHLSHNAKWIRSVVSLVGVFAVAIVVALALSSERLQVSSFDQSTAKETVTAWIGDADIEVVEVTVTPSKVSVTVSGPNQPPSVDDLGQSMGAALGRLVSVEVDWIPDQQFVYDPSG